MRKIVVSDEMNGNLEVGLMEGGKLIEIVYVKWGNGIVLMEVIEGWLNEGRIVLVGIVGVEFGGVK